MRAQLRLSRIQLRNYRCFDDLVVDLDDDLTVVHAENGGGKTALLSGIAVALAAAIFEKGGSLKPSDVKAELSPESLTAVSHYPCRVEADGIVGGRRIKWARALSRPGRRTTNAEAKEVREVTEHIWGAADASWPVVAFYGTQRLWGVVKQSTARKGRTRREDGYVDSLDPRSKEKQLLDWLFQASLAKLQRLAPSPEFLAVERALRTALRHPTDSGDFNLKEIRYDIGAAEPVLIADHGRTIRWSQLSDGEHVFAGLVADLARRCATLNPQLGPNSVLGASGVVLIDEVDLHLHPRWQRVVLGRLRAAFPGIQFIISTHSPQVLSSVKNTQVRTLRQGRLAPPSAVEGRDSNSILRDAFGTPDRDLQSGPVRLLDAVDDAIATGDIDRARKELDRLRAVWPPTDPELIRLEREISWMEPT